MSELKPCPFCGGEASYSVIHTNTETITGEIMMLTTNNCGCERCNIGFSSINNKEDAIEAWNTRTPPNDEVRE